MSNIKKSIDFRNVGVSIDSADQLLAEQTADKVKLAYIQKSIKNNEYGDLTEISFEDGTVRLYKKDAGLYSGFFVDRSGQVIHKYDDVTPAILCKNMDIQGIGTVVEANDLVEEVVEASESGTSPSYVKIKCGDFELEIKKSMRSFIDTNRDKIKGK